MITHVMWFRKDLRLEDNTAFYCALESLKHDEEILCLFHLDPKQYHPKTPGHDYFFTALAHFKKALSKENIKLHLISGDLIDSFSELKKIIPTWRHLYFNLDNRGYGSKRDLSVVAFLDSLGITSSFFEESHLHQATKIVKADGTPYQKFTPYYKKWLSLSKLISRKISLAPYIPSIAYLPHLTKDGNRELENLLNFKKYDFTQHVGEVEASDVLHSFVHESIDKYHIQRDFPGINGTSNLSPYLATGQISIRKVWQVAQDSENTLGQETFLKELAWRDFYHMIYYYHPHQYNLELIPKYQGLKWSHSEDFFEAWKNGKTGYPIIDAAMKQLNETGWMHNRLRMLTASFLTKDLLVDWRLGERYFSEMLIDYDSASNISGWQWAASTGTDSVPYFRIFNPTVQSLKFDKNGEFIKKYLPELAAVPTRYIHEPIKIPHNIQKDIGMTMGTDYPFPVIDHTFARERALSWFQEH